MYSNFANNDSRTKEISARPSTEVYDVPQNCAFLETLGPQGFSWPVDESLFAMTSSRHPSTEVNDVSQNIRFPEALDLQGILQPVDEPFTTDTFATTTFSQNNANFVQAFIDAPRQQTILSDHVHEQFAPNVQQPTFPINGSQPPTGFAYPNNSWSMPMFYGFQPQAMGAGMDSQFFGHDLNYFSSNMVLPTPPMEPRVIPHMQAPQQLAHEVTYSQSDHAHPSITPYGVGHGYAAPQGHVYPALPQPRSPLSMLSSEEAPRWLGRADMTAVADVRARQPNLRMTSHVTPTYPGMLPPTQLHFDIHRGHTEANPDNQRRNRFEPYSRRPRLHDVARDSAARYPTPESVKSTSLPPSDNGDNPQELLSHLPPVAGPSSAPATAGPRSDRARAPSMVPSSEPTNAIAGPSSRPINAPPTSSRRRSRSSIYQLPPSTTDGKLTFTCASQSCGELLHCDESGYNQHVKNVHFGVSNRCPWIVVDEKNPGSFRPCGLPYRTYALMARHIRKKHIGAWLHYCPNRAMGCLYADRSDHEVKRHLPSCRFGPSGNEGGRQDKGKGKASEAV